VGVRECRDDLQLGPRARRQGDGLGPRSAESRRLSGRTLRRVPDQVSLQQAQQSARLAALSVIASLEDALRDLDRIDAWLSVTGFVQAQPGYAQTTSVLNSFSEVVLDVFGASAGAHARTAIGVAALPLNLPVVVGAELHLTPPPLL
jgi:enamine deaminase RidA (YjgF/YER057c/UK114 family)